MDAVEPPSLEPVGGIIMLVVVFLLREIVSGALKEIGKDVWGWVKRRRASGRVEPVFAEELADPSAESEQCLFSRCH